MVAWRTASLVLVLLAAEGCGSFVGVAPVAEVADAPPREAAGDDGSQPPSPFPMVTLARDSALPDLSGADRSDRPFKLEVPAGATALVFHLGTGTSADNNADLYVSFGAQPTLQRFDCRSARVGLTEECTFAAPLAGTYFALVHGVTSYSGAELVVTFTPPAAPGPGPGPGPGPAPGGTAGATLSVHLTLGMPDSSTVSTSNAEHYLSVKPQYVVSYNSTRRVANWASWELNGTYLGAVARSDDFRPDQTLPVGLPQASNADYVGSGFDRGHLCPSADRTKTAADNSSTFYLTNMVPQAANNNRGPWALFENYERDLVRSGGELFIVAGGVFGATVRTVGAGVAVPTSTFKVVVVLPAPATSASAVNASTRVIALLVPNDDAQVGLADDWRKYRVTARELETRTGLNFLSDVPQSIQDAIETRLDAQ